jgi:hypothetical protein
MRGGYEADALPHLTNGRQMKLPDHVTTAWLQALSDENLLLAETKLHGEFAALEREQKKLLGAAYDMRRAPAELWDAWDRWSRARTHVGGRKLVVHRKH